MMPAFRHQIDQDKNCADSMCAVLKQPLAVVAVLSALTIGGCETSVVDQRNGTPVENFPELPVRFIPPATQESSISRQLQESISLTWTQIDGYLASADVHEARGISCLARGDNRFVAPESLGNYGYFRPMLGLMRRTLALAQVMAPDAIFDGSGLAGEARSSLESAIKFIESKGQVGSYEDLDRAGSLLKRMGAVYQPVWI